MRLIVDQAIEGCGLPDVARAVARGAAAGLPLAEAFARGAESMDDTMAEAMRHCAAALRAGHPTPIALAPIGVVSGGALLVGAIDLQHELGGDLVAALNGIAEGLADRERLRLEARAATAQARMAARIVPLAPIGALCMLAVLAPTSAEALLTSRPGIAIVSVSGALTLTALWLLRRIARNAGL
ncbi:MAG: type II secretion system F family protein [Gaiellales bacterium]